MTVKFIYFFYRCFVFIIVVVLWTLLFFNIFIVIILGVNGLKVFCVSRRKISRLKSLHVFTFELSSWTVSSNFIYSEKSLMLLAVRRVHGVIFRRFVGSSIPDTGAIAVSDADRIVHWFSIP